tara:strand:- start:1161 stop:1280 length:120 start_codon:yes stop_codon:yes gene_type:complete
MNVHHRNVTFITEQNYLNGIFALESRIREKAEINRNLGF